jgi:hypothetical protein
MTKYEIIIYWSESDDVLREVNYVASEWIEIAKEKGWQIPEPKGRLVFA